MKQKTTKICQNRLDRLESCLNDIGWPATENLAEDFHEMIDYFFNTLNLSPKQIAGFTGYSDTHINLHRRKYGWKSIGKTPGTKAKIHSLPTGEQGTMPELCAMFNVNFHTVTARKNKGSTLEEALKTPVKTRPKVESQPMPASRRDRKQWDLAKPHGPQRSEKKVKAVAYPAFYEEPPARKIRANWLGARYRARQRAKLADNYVSEVMG